MLITILATAFVLGVLILAHETGHFVVAKLADIEVPRFSIGFGPKLVGFRIGETEYIISALPLGGYVKMAGMEEMEAVEGGDRLPGGQPREHGPRDFESKPLGVRALVLSAGVFMNVVLAFVLYSGIALVWGVQTVPEARVASVDTTDLGPGASSLGTLPRDDRVVAVNGHEVVNWDDFITRLATVPAGNVALHFSGGSTVHFTMPSDDRQRDTVLAALQPELTFPPVLAGVISGLPAAQAGLQPGDTVVSIAGQPVTTWQQFRTVVEAHPGDTVSVGVRRAGSVLQFRIAPRSLKSPTDEPGAKPVGEIGVSVMIPTTHPGLIGAIREGAHEVWYWTKFIFGFLIQLLTGKASPRSLGGPLIIGKLSGQMAREGMQALLGFMGLLSINLAIFNLLPIPILDGGHLMFLAIEGVRGRALSVEQRIRLSQLGLVVLVAFFIWVMANDVLRLFGV